MDELRRCICTVCKKTRWACLQEGCNPSAHELAGGSVSASSNDAGVYRWWVQTAGTSSGTATLTVDRTTAPVEPERPSDPMELWLDYDDHPTMGVIVLRSGVVTVDGMSDEEGAREIALACARRGSVGKCGSIAGDGSLRLGRVVVFPSGGWDHPAAGDLDARSRAIWSAVATAWSELPAWARRAR